MLKPAPPTYKHIAMKMICWNWSSCSWLWASFNHDTSAASSLGNPCFLWLSMPSFIFNGWWWSWLVPWCQWWQSPHPPMQAGTKQERSRKPDISLNSDVLLWIPRNCSCLNRRALDATVSVGLNLWSVSTASPFPTPQPTPFPISPMQSPSPLLYIKKHRFKRRSSDDFQFSGHW